MASAILKRLYREERSNPRTMRVGFQAVDAWRDAIVRRKWEALESAGFVRLATPDDDSPDLSFLDMDDESKDRGAVAWAKRVRDKAENEGVFGLVGEYRVDLDTEDWEHGHSVWGFVGYDDVDPQSNPYATDIMLETIGTFRAAHKLHVKHLCPCCNGTGKRHADHV